MAERSSPYFGWANRQLLGVRIPLFSSSAIDLIVVGSSLSLIVSSELAVTEKGVGQFISLDRGLVFIHDGADHFVTGRRAGPAIDGQLLEADFGLGLCFPGLRLGGALHDAVQQDVVGLGWLALASRLQVGQRCLRVGVRSVTRSRAC